MNNIQKSFKSKARCGLRMAVGGVIADPTDQQRTPDSDLDRLTAQSNMSAAMAGLSNTERYQLANPTNAPYKANSMMGGTSAEASMLRQRSGILASLRDRLAEQQQPTLPSLRFADGGIINTLRNRGAVIDAAVDSAGTPAPVAAPVATAPALPSQAADYAAQAAALEAEQLAAARAAAAPKPKQGLMSRLGFAQGGVVRLQGPGTGTSDDIPLTLNTGGEGMNINVSNGEGLAVLPAKTMQHPEAVAAVNDIIETTNGKPPRGLKAGASYADGSAPYKLGSDPELEQKRMVDAGLASPDSTGFGSSVGNSLRRFTVAHSNDPDSVAVRSGTATPEQLQRAKGGMARAMETDSPFDVAAPIAPLGASVKAAVEAAPGVVSRGLSAVRGMLPSFGKSAEPVAAKAAAAPVAEVAAPVAKTLSREAADYLAANAAKDAKFAKAATPAVATSPAGAVGNIPARGNVANAVGQTVTSDDTRVVTPAAAIEPGAQERTFGASGAAPAPTSAAVADTEKPANDIQVRSIRGANGKMQPEFYGKNVTQTYTGADGKPTTNWYETQAYKDSQVQAAKDKELLKTYEKWGLEGDLKSNNPAYQARGLARQKAFDENSRTEAAREVAAANRDLQRQELDIRREDLGLRRSQEQRAIAGAQFDRQLKMDEVSRKATEDMDKDEEQAFKAYAPYFTRRGKDSQGNDVDLEDKDAHAAFVNAARHTVTQRGILNPRNGKPLSFGSLNKAEQERLYNRWMAVQRLKSTMGNFPWNADKADSLNLDDFDAVQNNDGTLSFPKLEARMKGRSIRARQKDFEYTEPYSWIDPFQTPDNTPLQNLVSRSR